MVVIRAEEKFITETFGNDFIGRIWDFSGIIGYTPERDGNEIKVEFNPDRPDLFPSQRLSLLYPAIMTERRQDQ